MLFYWFGRNALEAEPFDDGLGAKMRQLPDFLPTSEAGGQSFFPTLNASPKALHMKWLMAVSFFLAGSQVVNAQNVGIGTASPLARLHVSSNTNPPIIADGGENMYIGLYEEGAYRGYIGSYAGSTTSVDFGTGVSNFSGSVHLTIRTNPALTVYSNSYVGIGDLSPDEKLVIGSGNLKMSNSNLGVMLNNADRPLITRGWDPFTSGNYNGVGRWGLFMEPTKLTLGFPGYANAGLEVASYNANSTRDILLTVRQNGELNRPPTGGADLLPVCMGSVRWNNGTLANTPIINGTGNFTLTPYADEGFVEITINGHYYTTTGYVVMVTCIRDDSYGSSTGRAVVKDSGNGKLQVYTYINGNTQYSRSFHFVVYKM